MPIKLSNALKKKLPENEQADIVEWLWTKSSGLCFLCEQPVNRHLDELVADHDEVSAVGGVTSRKNLNLVHARCNLKKGGLTTSQARQILSVEEFLVSLGASQRYGDVLPHFDIVPHPVTVDDTGDRIGLQASGDASPRYYDVFSEANGTGEFRFAYVELGRSEIYNDDDCQPRNIKPKQLRSIYLDLETNPLHEPPSCRLVPFKGAGQLRMFDGQHKTVASWMHGRQSVVVKLYLDLDVDAAVTLVNSIQSKIKKLPLTPFELIAKLDQEHQAKWDAYQKATLAHDVSEAGFVASLAPAERSKAKQGLESAVIRSVLEDGDEPLALFQMYVRGEGLPEGQKPLTEAAFKNKVLRRLLHVKPIKATAAEAVSMRERERIHLLRSLNELAARAFTAEGGLAGVKEQERARRMSYQSALQHISFLLKRAFIQILKPVDQDLALMEREPTGKEWEEVETAIAQIVEHPIWTVDWDTSAKTRAVRESLLKNQDAGTAFTSVMLTPGYVVGADPISAACCAD